MTRSRVITAAVSPKGRRDVGRRADVQPSDQLGPHPWVRPVGRGSDRGPAYGPDWQLRTTFTLLMPRR